MARLWEAVLDDLTCDYCEAMHGTVIRDDQDWEVMPGDVHPNCRCVEVLIMDSVAEKIDPGFKERPGAVFHQDKEAYTDIPAPLYEVKEPSPGPVTSVPWIAALLLLDKDEEDEEERKPWLKTQVSTYAEWTVW